MMLHASLRNTDASRLSMDADLAIVRNLDTGRKLVINTDNAADHFVHLLGVPLVLWPFERVLPNKGYIQHYTTAPYIALLAVVDIAFLV